MMEKRNKAEKARKLSLKSCKLAVASREEKIFV